MLSTHAEPIRPDGTELTVLRKGKIGRQHVVSGPMHIQYQQNMRGVDSADQMRGSYKMLSKSHKWWHRLFYFLLDTTIENSWIMHSNLSFKFFENPMSHLDFYLQMANSLASKWPHECQGYSKFNPDYPRAHGLLSMGIDRKACQVCKRRCAHIYVPWLWRGVHLPEDLLLAGSLGIDMRWVNIEVSVFKDKNYISNYKYVDNEMMKKFEIKYVW